MFSARGGFLFIETGDVASQVIAFGRRGVASTTPPLPSDLTSVFVYPWNENFGYGTKLNDPPSLDNQYSLDVRDLSFTKAYDALAIAYREIYSTPITPAAVFSWNSTGWGTKYSDPVTPLNGNFTTRVVFTSTGDAIAITNDTIPSNVQNRAVYAWSTSGWGTKYSNPTFSGSQVDRGVDFTTARNAIGWATDDTYQWNSGTGFGTQYSNPSPPTPNLERNLEFSENDEFVSIATSNTSYSIFLYPWDSSTGYGSRFSQPADPPVGEGRWTWFNHASNVVGLSATDGTSNFSYIKLWSISSSGFGSSYSAQPNPPGMLQSQFKFSKNDQSLAIAGISGSYGNTDACAAYKWDNTNGWGPKFSNPSPLPSYGSLGTYTIAFGYPP